MGTIHQFKRKAKLGCPSCGHECSTEIELEDGNSIFCSKCKSPWRFFEGKLLENEDYLEAMYSQYEAGLSDIFD